MKDWLEEQLKTILNLCDIALLINKLGERRLLPTLVELIYLEAQGALDDHCIENVSTPEPENTTG